MKLWKRNAVVAAIVLFVCVAVYLNWSYSKDTTDAGKVLGQATLVGGQTTDPLLTAGKPGAAGVQATATPAPNASPVPEARKSGYFSAARLNRQQARDSALTILQQTAESADAEQTMKDEAGASIQTLASCTVSEAQIENLVMAKGYADCVAFIGENSVSVVVAAGAEGLAEADVAKITEIVTDETGYAASQIKIIPAEE